MFSCRRFFSLSCTVLSLLLWQGPNAQAQNNDPFREESAIGTTDWTQGTLEATGQGTARYMGNKAQEELLAKQAARTMAQARLVELVRGVRVTGLTTLDAHARSDTRAATRIRGMLKGAQTVTETVTWQPDSESRRGESVLAEVTLRLCLQAPCAGPSLSTASFEAPASTAPQSTQADAEQSAVILDLNQALYLPSLAPQVVDAQGAVLFDQSYVNADARTQKGLIHYTQSVAEAQNIIGSTAPITILEVAHINDENQIVLSGDTADQLRDHAALALGRVYVALD